jgi:hypothetical protein
MDKKELIAFFISLILTVAFLDIFKMGFLLSFIVGTILWSLLHFNIKKILKRMEDEKI